MDGKRKIMGKWKYLNRFTAFFFVFILFFTFFSGQLRKKTMPDVMVMWGREKEFPVTVCGEDGTEYTTKKVEFALPGHVLNFAGDFSGSLDFGESGGMASVFVLEETKEGFFVRERLIKFGGQADGWFEVESGVGRKDRVVCAADRKLADGDRVNLIVPEK